MISNPKVIGGFTYENVILSPEQFIVISSQSISVRSPDLVDWVMGTQPNIIPMML
jgi:hypothetical protein